MSYFFYNYLVVKSLINTKSLYFTKFVLRLYRYIPFLLKLVEVVFRYWGDARGLLLSKFIFKFILFSVYQFTLCYQAFCSLRVLLDYYCLNLNETNKPIKAIYEVTEPYFEFIENTFPKNAMGSLFGFYSLWVASYLIRRVYVIIGKYYNNSDYLVLCNTLLLLEATSDEKIVFN